MMNNPTAQVGNHSESDEDEEEKPLPRYYISVELAKLRNRSLPVMIANRMGYMSRQALEEEPKPDSDVKPYVNQIADVDSQDPDFLLPDTPLKEAIFRVILANRNEPMTAEEISGLLSEKWAMTAYPRDLSPRVIQRLIDHSESYCIVKVDEPEEG